MEGNRTVLMKKSNRYLEDLDVRHRRYDYANQFDSNEKNKKHLESANLNHCFHQKVTKNQFPTSDTHKLAHFISQSDPVGLRHNHLVEKKSLTPTRRKPIKPVFFQSKRITNRAQGIKSPKISCSVPVINCVVGDKQQIYDRNCGGRNMNSEEDNESFTDKTFRVHDHFETGNSPRRFNKRNYFSKHNINKTKHRYLELESKFHNMLKEKANNEKIYINLKSPVDTSSSEFNVNYAEEGTLSKGSHIVLIEQRRRRNASHLQFYSKYNKSLGSRFYKARHRHYNPIDYTSSTHPVSCSSECSLRERYAFVRRRRRRVRNCKTRSNRDKPPKSNLKKPLESPNILKTLNVCEIPESRYFGDGEKCRKTVAIPKNNNKLRDVNNNNITPNPQTHKAVKPKVTEEDMWKRFQKIFRSYSSTKLHSGDLISPKISTCWMKNVGVVKDVLNNKEAETAFKKAAGQKITMNVHEYKDFLLSLTMKRKLPLYEIYRRMCGI